MTKHQKLTVATGMMTAICALAAPASANGKKVLGVALPNLTNPYYVEMKKSFEVNGAAEGFVVKVLIADNDPANQLSQVQTFKSSTPQRSPFSRSTFSRIRMA